MAGVVLIGFGGLWLEYMIGKNTAFLSIRTPEILKAGGWEMRFRGGGSKHDVK
jgi:hypothetical protein